MSVLNIDARRAWLISDTHFGVRNNSKEWMEIMEDYFFHFLIPLIRSEYRPGDILIHCGDTFDSRQAINLYVMNRGMEIIEALAEVLPVYIIIGNHDIFMKHTNEINSMKLFKHTRNVVVFEKPQLVRFGQTTGMFLPWIESASELREFVQNPQNQADLLFCHTDVRGISFNRTVKVEEGNEPEVFTNYKQVYSGHIHYAQKHKNIRMLGSPYQLTRSDAGNPKSVWLVDLETLEEQSWVNTHSPKFLRYRLEWLLEQNLETIQKMFHNNFVDIHITTQWSLKFPFSVFLENITGYRKINHVILTEDGEEKNLDEEDGDMEAPDSISIVNLIETYIQDLVYTTGIKERLTKTSLALYHETLRDMEKNNEMIIN
jgi:DNA repair exonuclease SbcCD nuclease subunit